MTYLAISPEQAKTLGEWVATGERMALVEITTGDEGIKVCQGNGYVTIDGDGNKTEEVDS